MKQSLILFMFATAIRSSYGAFAAHSSRAAALVTRSVASKAAQKQWVHQMQPYHYRGNGASATIRFMSDASTGPDTTIVDTCRDKITTALEAADCKVLGAYDDPNGSHISIEVVSSMFEGKRPVQRQQLVYKAIWEELQGPVHAVDSMICKTPNEV